MRTSRNSRAIPDARAIGAIMGHDGFTICLSDGRQILVPYHCFPRLHAATPPQRAHFEVCAGGRMLHWPEIDEDIEVLHIIEGRLPVKEPAPTSIVAESRPRYGA